MHLRAGAGLIALTTDDEARAVAMLEHIGTSLEWPVHTWSLSSGVDDDGRPHPLARLLQGLAGEREPGLWLLLDADHPNLDPVGLRAARELAGRRQGPVVVSVSRNLGPLAQLPETVLEHLPLPGTDELADTLNCLAQTCEPSLNRLLAAQSDDLIECGRGLTSLGFDRLVREGLLATAHDHSLLVNWARSHKQRFIGQEPALEPCPVLPAQLLGGLCSYKKWLERRARALEPAAREAGIPTPRGVLLIGVQGCGKSLAARASASILGLPLFRLDPGRVFQGTVGASEHNLRRILTDAERLAPMVLWVDEIDKSLAGSEGAKSDAGTTSRVVSGLLTWLQERTRPVFVVMTANNIQTLPPELIRRGRLDELFFVDLPSPHDRREILQVHLQHVPRANLGRVPPLADPVADFLDLAGAAEGFSGAELAAALVEARLDAYTESRPLAVVDLRHALAACIPLSRTRAEDVAALRTWAKNRARPA